VPTAAIPASCESIFPAAQTRIWSRSPATSGSKSLTRSSLPLSTKKKAADGNKGYFNKLVSRETVKDQLEKQAKQASSSRKKSSSGKDRQPVGHY
jgi:hypothetical protein